MQFNRFHTRSFREAFRVSPLTKYARRFYSNKGNQWLSSRDSGLTHFNSSGNSNRSSGGGNPFFNFFRNIPFMGKAVLFLGFPASYYLYHIEKVPISNRTRMMDVSRKTEMKLGEQTWQIIKYNYGKQFLPPNHPTSLLVKRISQRLIQVSGLQDNLNWEFVVIESPEANAFVIPNGKVCVFTGLFKMVKNEDQLATVLSHEIAHVIARHSAENWSWTRILTTVNFVVSLVFQIDPNTLLRPALMLGITLPKSREAEAEADHIGLHLMAKACYHPNAALSLWDNFQKAEKYKTGVSLTYLSTHPSNMERKKNIEGWLPEANRIRDSSGCDELEAQLQAFRYRQQ